MTKNRLRRSMILMLLVNFVSDTEEWLALNLRASDVIIDPREGFALQWLVLYSSELKEDLVHSVIPFGGLCTSSLMIEQCTVTSLPCSKTLIELITISPSYDIVSALLRIHRSKNLLAAITSIVHLARDEFYSVTDNNGAIDMQPSSPLEDEQMHIPKLAEFVRRTYMWNIRIWNRHWSESSVLEWVQHNWLLKQSTKRSQSYRFLLLGHLRRTN